MGDCGAFVCWCCGLPQPEGESRGRWGGWGAEHPQNKGPSLASPHRHAACSGRANMLSHCSGRGVKGVEGLKGPSLEAGILRCRMKGGAFIIAQPPLPKNTASYEK